MSWKRLRTYPPIIALLISVLLVTAAAVNAIFGDAAARAKTLETSNQPAIQPEAETLPEECDTRSCEAIDEDQKFVIAIHDRSMDGKPATESEILLRIAMAEAEGESVEGKALVMLVVLNRVQSNQFPDTVEEVVFQPRQFPPAAIGGRYYTTEPDAGCYEALELVMDGWDESQGALYFESGAEDSWHSRNLMPLFEYGGHKFYR